MELGEIYPFPEKVVQERMANQVALMTVVACFCDVMTYGGSYDRNRNLWGQFRSTLVEDHPQQSISRNLPFTVVSIVFYSFFGLSCGSGGNGFDVGVVLIFVVF